ncbi:hypothetical protein DY000_02053855 [Brassica cretica]|uniref:Aspartic peptidase DDI1-type domain-containing protein n=1 Tax=Brassica cretica TaxID=69181 RepID=A0ABQ7AIT2_BRACR|nr:hypothetical protein DY000_02053855 [Brassica cretica]
MFFRETKETEEDIRRMFHQVRDKMKNRITLKKKSDPQKCAIPCLVKGIEFPHALCDTGASVSILPRVMAGQLCLKVEPSRESFTFVDCSQRNSGGNIRDLEVQICNALVPVNFHVLDIKLNWNSSLLLGRVFLSTVGADSGLIAACHCGAEYKTVYSESIETHTRTSIDSLNHQKSIDSLNHQKSIDNHLEESIDSSLGDVIEDFPEGSIDSWENDYYNTTFAVDTATPSDRDNLHT